MNLGETAKLLTAAAAFDQRTIGEADVVAWHRLLQAYSYEEAELALDAHYGSTCERLMPFDVISRVKAIRAERLRAAGALVPPVGLSDTEELAWLKAARERIASGLEGPQGIEGPR